MSDYLDHIVFMRDVPPERLEELRALLRSDPRAARDFAAWVRLRESLQRDVHDAIGDPNDFVLCILAEYDDGAALTGAERGRAHAVLPAFRHTMDRHPGLRGVADDICAAAKDFDRIWGEEMGLEPEAERSHGSGHGEARPARPPRRDSSSSARWGVRAAAGAALLVFVSLLVFVLQRDHGMTTVTSGAEARVVELGDGSTARLLPNTTLSFTPPDDAAPLGRQAVLEGRAYFEIAPVNGGLVVKTPTAQMTVLGTSFGVRANGDATEVVLAEGRLSLSTRTAPASAVELQAGQMSRVAAGASPSSPEDVMVHEQLSWTGLFVFTSTPLSAVASTLEEHYGTSVELASGLESERLTGRFERAQPLPEILGAIASAVGADIRPTPTGAFRIVRD